MKALALDQPLAQALARNVHDTVVRGRPPRGSRCPPGVASIPGVPLEPGERVALVAKQRWAPGWLRWRQVDSAWGGVLAALGIDARRHGSDDTLLRTSFDDLPTGMVVGIATFTGAIPIVPPGGYASTFYEAVADPATADRLTAILQPGAWVEGAWVWSFTDGELISPVYVRLDNHLADLPPDADEAVTTQLKEHP